MGTHPHSYLVRSSSTCRDDIFQHFHALIKVLSCEDMIGLRSRRIQAQDDSWTILGDGMKVWWCTNTSCDLNDKASYEWPSICKIFKQGKILGLPKNTAEAIESKQVYLNINQYRLTKSLPCLFVRKDISIMINHADTIKRWIYYHRREGDSPRIVFNIIHNYHLPNLMIVKSRDWRKLSPKSLHHEDMDRREVMNDEESTQDVLIEESIPDSHHDLTTHGYSS